MDTKKIQEAVKMIIDAVGEDGSREGLQENTRTHCQDVPRDFCRSQPNCGSPPIKIF